MCRFSAALNGRRPAGGRRGPGGTARRRASRCSRRVAPTAAAARAARSGSAARVPRTSRRPGPPAAGRDAPRDFAGQIFVRDQARVPAGSHRRSRRGAGCDRRRRPVSAAASIHSGSSTRSWNSRPTWFSSSIATSISLGRLVVAVGRGEQGERTLHEQFLHQRQERLGSNLRTSP